MWGGGLGTVDPPPERRDCPGRAAGCVSAMASETSQPVSPHYVRCTPAPRFIDFLFGARELKIVQRGSRR
jgi:hypothetical protein